MPANVIGISTPNIEPEDVLFEILEWVGEELPSHEGAAVNRLTDYVGKLYKVRGTNAERIPGSHGYGDVL